MSRDDKVCLHVEKYLAGQAKPAEDFRVLCDRETVAKWSAMLLQDRTYETVALTTRDALDFYDTGIPCEL